MTIAAPLSFEEYLTYTDAAGDPESRYELVEGCLIPMNPPTVAHFLIAKFLEQKIDAAIRATQHSWLCLREAGVRTGPSKVRLCDLCVVTTEQARALLTTSAVFQTAPLLIVEVVSPDSVKRDYRYKVSEYAALGVPEYWIVDPLTAQVTVMQLEEGLYETQLQTGNQQMISPALPALDLTVDQILAAGQI